ncbi:MAG TPA: zinc-ribbon domain-containing protein, partial [Ktedonobacteraceae bacterium]|nr:zinc-ribbon domain-containing protein [Ktedonobacteraceae bacterium]
MHQCLHCQAELADNAQFCARCGKPVEVSQTSSAAPTTADTSVEAEAEITSKQPAISLSATPALPTLRTRRMHPQSSISAFPADSWQALETPEDEAGATETAPEDAANALAEVALETPAEQKAFGAPAQTARTTPEPADVEDIDTISLSMTELAEIAATPLDAPAPTTPVAPVAPAAQAPAAEKAEDATGEAVTAPVTQTPAQAEAASAVSREPLSPVPATPEPQAVDVADLPTSHIPTAAVPPTL